MKYIYTLLLTLLFVFTFKAHSSDANVRGKVVKVMNLHGGFCTGTSIQSLSGKPYILSANHCIEDGDKTVMIQTEDGRILQREIIGTDALHDLLLIAPVSALDHGLKIADSIDLHEHLRAFVHGGGMDTYKIEGEYFQDMKAPQLGVPDLMATTLDIIPGCSGGSAVNAYDEVVGVADMINVETHIGFFVSLRHIRNFLVHF